MMKRITRRLLLLLVSGRKARRVLLGLKELSGLKVMSGRRALLALLVLKEFKEARGVRVP